MFFLQVEEEKKKRDASEARKHLSLLWLEFKVMSGHVDKLGGRLLEVCIYKQ